MGPDLYHTADRSVRVEAVVASLGVIALAFVLGGVVASTALAIGNSLGITITEDTTPVAYYALSTLFSFIGFLLVAVGYVYSQGKTDLINYRRPTRSDLGWIVGGFLALVVAATVIGQLLGVFGIESAQNQIIEKGRASPVLFVLLVPITVFAVAPAEELLFRGIVQGEFRRAYGPLPAVVIASLLFGISHSGALSGSGQITYLAVASILGLVLGVVYERTDNVVVTIAIHAAWNCMLYLSEWLAVVHGIELPI